MEGGGGRYTVWGKIQMYNKKHPQMQKKLQIYQKAHHKDRGGGGHENN